MIALTEDEYELIVDRFQAIVEVTSLQYGRNPNRMRAIAGQIARTALDDLRRSRPVCQVLEE